MTRGVVAPAGTTFPDFVLPAADGGRVELETYRGRRNLVVVCAGAGPLPGTLARLLDELAKRGEEVASEAAQVITVVTTAEAARNARRAGFPVVLDEAARLHARVGASDDAGRPAPAVFVTDRFREIYATYVLTPGAPLPDARAVLGWLVFINIQCPECGAPEWPA